MAKSINATSYLEVSAKTRKGLDKVFKVAVNCVQEYRSVPFLTSHPARTFPANTGMCVCVCVDIYRGVSTSKENSTTDGNAENPVVVKPKKKNKGCLMM